MSASMISMAPGLVTADLVIRAGRIYTMSATQPVQRAMKTEIELAMTPPTGSTH
jgi:hypothetical protein